VVLLSTDSIKVSPRSVPRAHCLCARHLDRWHARPASWTRSRRPWHILTKLRWQLSRSNHTFTPLRTVEYQPHTRR